MEFTMQLVMQPGMQPGMQSKCHTERNAACQHELTSSYILPIIMHPDTHFLIKNRTENIN